LNKKEACKKDELLNDTSQQKTFESAAGSDECSAKNSRRKRFPRWVVAVICVLATAVFMLTPPGQAVSGFIYNADTPQNEETSISKIVAKLNGKRLEYNNAKDVIAAYPEFPILANDNFTASSITVAGDAASVTITSIYIADGNEIEAEQTIFFSEFGFGGNIKVSGDAVVIDTHFNNGTIGAYGGHERGYGHVRAWDSHSMYTFSCNNVPADTFISFIESCYLTEA